MGSPNIKSDTTRRVLQKNLRGILQNQQLSENELAKRANTSQKHINNITNARSGCGVDTLDYVARTLHIPTWALLVPGADEIFDDLGRLERVVATYVSASHEDRAAIYRVITQFPAKK